MPHLLRFLSHNIHKLLHAYISYQLSVISYQLSVRKRQKSKGKRQKYGKFVSCLLSPVSFVLFVTFFLKNVS
ncbi:hypothetical protein [Microcystis sp. MC19]|uniref:hypothetical protein n=1 Tax=Microcystis sp. MC19 TaxID=1967666 RepID=UPI001570868B|nr:hypothetical protein [Microcystis sp. MC19]